MGACAWEGGREPATPMTCRAGYLCVLASKSICNANSESGYYIFDPFSNDETEMSRAGWSHKYLPMISTEMG